MDKEHWKKLRQYNGKERIISSRQMARRVERKRNPLKMRRRGISPNTLLEGIKLS